MSGQGGKPAGPHRGLFAGLSYYIGTAAGFFTKYSGGKALMGCYASYKVVLSKKCLQPL